MKVMVEGQIKGEDLHENVIVAILIVGDDDGKMDAKVFEARNASKEQVKAAWEGLVGSVMFGMSATIIAEILGGKP